MESTAAILDATQVQEAEDGTSCTGSEASVPNTGVGTLSVVNQETQLYEEWKQREMKLLEYLQEVTSNPRAHQERLLEQILKKNANSLYLQQLGLNGATDARTFRQLVPVCDYEDVRPLVQRVIDGDKTQILSGDPVTVLFASSGTTGGQSKLYPITEEDMSNRNFLTRLTRPVLNQKIPGLDRGKCMLFYTVLPGWTTAGGLLCSSAVTSEMHSKGFRQRPFDPSFRMTSPDAVILAPNHEESIYCHLICGLLQREEVLRIGALFSSVLVRCIQKLKEWWPEICEDLAEGTLSGTKVQDASVRAAVQPYLRADAELAAFVRQECSRGSWEGIVRRLWHNCKVLDTTCTGSMAAYTPILRHYGNNLPLITSNLYASSEGYFGLNLNPMSPPEEVCYTLIPTMAYFEFIPFSNDGHEDNENILDLSSVKEGQEYEILVTTFSGLCRYRVGDVLKMVGLYNAAPTFQFVGRKNTVLSVHSEKTGEKELLLGVTRAAELLEERLGFILQDFTSTVDFTSAPPHYVIYMELKRSSEPIIENIPTDLLERCCILVESSFSTIYRRNRANNYIGSLEMRIVKEGTFERLAEVAIHRGASPSQYKTPKGLGPSHSSQLQILADGLIQHHTCQSCPLLPEPWG